VSQVGQVAATSLYSLLNRLIMALCAVIITLCTCIKREAVTVVLQSPLKHVMVMMVLYARIEHVVVAE
jgi:hypothetical protein